MKKINKTRNKDREVKTVTQRIDTDIDINKEYVIVDDDKKIYSRTVTYENTNRIIMGKYAIFVLFILLSISLYGQEVEQEYGREFTMDNTQPVDEEKKCTEVVNEIDSIRLRCDTISIVYYTDIDMEYPHYFECIYYDEENSFRKYYWRLRSNGDGAAENIDFFAYYDKQGNLVHITYSCDHHCGSNNGYFYVYQGNVVDYYYSAYCDCCEADIDIEEDFVRPVIGNKLEQDFNGRPLGNFVDSKILLKILLDGEYSYCDVFFREVEESEEGDYVDENK